MWEQGSIQMQSRKFAARTGEWSEGRMRSRGRQDRRCTGSLWWANEERIARFVPMVVGQWVPLRRSKPSKVWVVSSLKHSQFSQLLGVKSIFLTQVGPLSIHLWLLHRPSQGEKQAAQVELDKALPYLHEAESACNSITKKEPTRLALVGWFVRCSPGVQDGTGYSMVQRCHSSVGDTRKKEYSALQRRNLWPSFLWAWLHARYSLPVPDSPGRILFLLVLVCLLSLKTVQRHHWFIRLGVTPTSVLQSVLCVGQHFGIPPLVLV